MVQARHEKLKPEAQSIPCMSLGDWFDDTFATITVPTASSTAGIKAHVLVLVLVAALVLVLVLALALARVLVGAVYC